MYHVSAASLYQVKSYPALRHHLIRLLALLITLTFTLSACKSTPAKEEESWKRNRIEMDESINMYPNLKGALVANRTRANEMWKRAKTIADEKTRLKAMKDANGVMRQVVGPLRRIELQLDTVEREVNRLSRKRLTGSAVMQREQALSTLTRDLERARQSLHSVSFQDPMQAKLYLDQQYKRSSGLRNRSQAVRKRFTKIKRNKMRNRNAVGKKRAQPSSGRPKTRSTTTRPVARPSARPSAKPRPSSTTRRPTRSPTRRTRSKSKSRR